MPVRETTAALARRFHLNDRAALALEATFGAFVRRNANDWQPDRFAHSVTEWLIQEGILPPTAQAFEFREALARAAELLNSYRAT
ncbi:hypothetical protein L602_001500000170 [Cupriavidus gilardii J11]|uniref:Uncharacterized protein n=1 Tax=Cupriavidus gilardii J11 TaxID=936133 RepID=A0A562BRW9_9BURK|nr:hypothetical protein L602_001500000170 [Cupriavidus gilardii J11]